LPPSKNGTLTDGPHDHEIVEALARSPGRVAEVVSDPVKDTEG
jgi:hypothetical protein